MLGASFLLVFLFLLLFCSSFEQSMQACHPTGLARPQTLGSSLQPGSNLVYCGQGFSHGAEQVSTAGAERAGPCPSPPLATTSPPEQYWSLWRDHQAHSVGQAVLDMETSKTWHQHSAVVDRPCPIWARLLVDM